MSQFSLQRNQPRTINPTTMPQNALPNPNKVTPEAVTKNMIMAASRSKIKKKKLEKQLAIVPINENKAMAKISS